MPYRRLPNTDAARIRAMKIALEKGREQPPYMLPFSVKNVVRLQRFLPLFENNIQLQRQLQSAQNKRNKNYYELQHKAKTYLIHFIRVMNMAVYRGEIPASTRTYYGIDENDATAPLFTTEKELIQAGRLIIEGEEERIRREGGPITNPTIAVVKVWFEKFMEAYISHQTTIKRTASYMEKSSIMRKEADEIILNVWDEIESSFKSLPEEEKRKKCEEYGIVYFFRKNEKRPSQDNDAAQTCKRQD